MQVANVILAICLIIFILQYSWLLYVWYAMIKYEVNSNDTIEVKE